MNQAHDELLASDGWRDMLENLMLPFAFEGCSFADLGDDVVEVGPGPGLTTDLFRERVAHLTAVEVDPQLAARLRSRLAGTNVEVIEADATTMPLEDGRFSGAVSFTMLHHVPTAALQDRLFGELRRVLAPGSLLVASDSVASADLEALHVDDVYNPIDPDGLPERLAAAGFVDVTVRANPFGWAAHARTPSADALA